MDVLCFCSVLCLLCLCARLFICALWSPAGKGLTSWLSFVVSNCEFVTFPLELVWVWYLIVSTPDLCTLTYFCMILGESFLYRIHCLWDFMFGPGAVVYFCVYFLVWQSST